MIKLVCYLCFLISVCSAFGLEPSQIRQVEAELAEGKRSPLLDGGFLVPYEVLYDEQMEKRGSYEGKPLIRFGKRASSPMNMNREGRDMLNNPLIRFGKRDPFSTPLVRFGKRDPFSTPLVRFGKRPESTPLIRFGKRAAGFEGPLVRFGKRSSKFGQPIVRFGRSFGQPIVRFGKRPASFEGPLVRFGKRNPKFGDPIVRFGRSFGQPIVRFGKRSALPQESEENVQAGEVVEDDDNNADIAAATGDEEQ
uniref:FMRFamide-related neuropeptides n=1 Tax=Rhabditophanes sp. KR3021 TaxID=114890 RepID=A0AC35U478_9BILA